jgi:hypothetical protein
MSRYARSPRLARRHRAEARGELPLAAMVDMMTNILLFLLNLYGATPVALESSKELQVARARSEDPVRYAVSVAVGRDRVRIGDTAVLMPADGAPWTEDARRQVGDALASAQQRRVDAAAQRGDPPPVDVLLQVDKRLAWSQVAPLVGLAAEAGLTEVRFVVAMTPEEPPQSR